MDDFSITQNGKPLDKSKYTIDLVNEVFASRAVNLELDFTGCHGWTFKTGENCTFKTGVSCTFRTGNECTFKTGYDCIFYTGHQCTFDTGNRCTFKPGIGCTFDTGGVCIFLLWDINSYKFKSYDDMSTILDRLNKRRYVLNKEYIQFQKVRNG